MSDNYPDIAEVTYKLIDSLVGKSKYILLYAHNGTGKTRLSMDFKKRSREDAQIKAKRQENTKYKAEIASNMKEINRLSNELDKAKNNPNSTEREEILDQISDGIAGYSDFNHTLNRKINENEKDIIDNIKLLPKNTLYYNAYTEDLFQWENNLDEDIPFYTLNMVNSIFFDGLDEGFLQNELKEYFEKYSDKEYKILPIDKEEKDKGTRFIRKIQFSTSSEPEISIKISRGEERIFVICFFLALCKLALTNDESTAYSWVKYIYVDDPVSSLDDNNAISIAVELANLFKKSSNEDIKIIISSHHVLFYNIICNELNNNALRCYFDRNKDLDIYSLHKTNEVPFSYHIAMLKTLKEVEQTGKIYKYHFNIMRSILEKTAVFLGYKGFASVIKNEADKKVFSRYLNSMSHGESSLFKPEILTIKEKELFSRILNDFIKEYEFTLPNGD